MILAPTQMQNNSSGNGRGYVPLRVINPDKEEMNKSEMDRLNALNDRRMRFKNSRDPIYIYFDSCQRASIKKLAREFVKDLISESFSFISKA